jgi:protein translocase SecG subunit
MNIIEKIWAALGLAIIFLILITDPKSSTNSTGNNKITAMFTSVTEEQKFVQRTTWIFIAIFFLLTIYIN